MGIIKFISIALTAQVHLSTTVQSDSLGGFID